MIRMISGTYGGRDGLKRASDGPFSLPANEEARLVERGVAVYVGNVETPLVGFDETPPADGEGAEPNGADELPKLPELPEGVTGIPEYSVEMTAAELREIGKACGLSFAANMGKAKMVDALDAFFAANMVDGVDEDEIQPDEDAPVFDAAEAVQ